MYQSWITGTTRQLLNVTQHFFTDIVTRHKPLGIHRSKISLHHAKAGYDYPSIRLPHTFSKLVGLPTRICQPNDLNDNPGKKYKGEQIGGKKYFFLHGHQFSFFRFQALLNFGDFMARNIAASRSFKWLTRFGLALLLVSLPVALLTNWISLLLIWLSGLLQSASLLSFPVTVILLLWGFLVFLGVLEVFRGLAFCYYEYTHHLGQIRYRAKRYEDNKAVNVQQLVSGGHYKAEKDTADVIVFGHTHTPEVSPPEVNGTGKLLITSGSWIKYRDRKYDTFVYIDQDGPLLLHWDDKSKSVAEIK